MNERPDRMPKWVENGIGGAIALFVLMFVGTMALPDDIRQRCADAGQAVGALGLLGAVAAAVIALRQIDLQRKSIEDQRRSFQLERYADLRHEYARLIGAAHDVVLSIALNNGDSKPLTEFSKFVQQIELHDRSEVRWRIVQQIRELFEERHDNVPVIRILMFHLRHLREMIKNIEPPGTPGNSYGMRVSSWGLLGLSHEQLLERAKTMNDLELNHLRADVLAVAQHALRASIAVDETLAKPLVLADVEDTIDGPSGKVTKAKRTGLRHMPALEHSRSDDDE
jgi:hypothetical protein